jgi:hypothetical protein
MSIRDFIGAVAVIGALAFGACDQNRQGTAERGGTTSAPASRSPSGEGTAARNNGTAATSPNDVSGTGGSGTGGAGDAGMGRDAGMR